MIIKHNKGFQLLGENTIKIIIAVLCILVLIYLCIQLFNMFLNNSSKALSQAKVSIEPVAGTIDLIKSGETLNKIILNPKNWFIKSYNIEQEAHPTGQCVGKFKSCLCFCYDFYCSGLKTCNGFNSLVEVDEFYNYYSTDAPEVTNSNPTEIKNTFQIYKVPLEISITKVQDKTIIKTLK